jgi:hypothetical protein
MHLRMNGHVLYVYVSICVFFFVFNGTLVENRRYAREFVI